MLCEALTHFKSENEINVPIFLKLTSDMELEGFKNILPSITKTFDGVILIQRVNVMD